MGTSVDNRSTKVDRKVVTESAARNLKRLVTVRIKDQLETNMALLFIGTLLALGFDMLAVYEGNIMLRDIELPIRIADLPREIDWENRVLSLFVAFYQFDTDSVIFIAMVRSRTL